MRQTTKGQHLHNQSWIVPKLLALIVSIGAATGLALWWDYRFWDSTALSFQQLVAGTTEVSSTTAALLLAFAAGASMIITA